MKFLFDLFPVILFFVSYVATGNIYTATAVTIAATIAQVAYVWFKHRKVDKMLWISLAVIVLMGGLTLMLHDKRFIMWKPTVLYWLFASGLLISMSAFKKNIIKNMLGPQITLPETIWNKLNWGWIAFFALMGILNLYVAYNYAEATWVKFKLFGGMGLMIVFILLQALVLSKYVDTGERK